MWGVSGGSVATRSQRVDVDIETISSYLVKVKDILYKIVFRCKWLGRHGLIFDDYNIFELAD